MSLQGCKKEECNSDCDLILYNPTPYTITRPQGFAEMVIPADNPMTVEGVALGRKLFYEKQLSGDNTMSCASCHIQQPFSFVDSTTRFSTGIDGFEGNRNAMTLINLGWGLNFFWDGRASSLEEQALAPVPNPIEMHQKWTDAIVKLEVDAHYPELFLRAFGVCEIDSMHVAMAIAQFERTMISGNSKFDKRLRFEVDLLHQKQTDFFYLIKIKLRQQDSVEAIVFTAMVRKVAYLPLMIFIIMV